MVGLVVVSHSQKIAEGAKELASQMAADVPIATAGGTSDGRIGTDIDKILAGINEVYSEDGVLVIFDLGSAYMNAEMALEFLDSDKRDKVYITDSAIIEGTVLAAIQCSMNKSILDIKTELEEVRIQKV